MAIDLSTIKKSTQLKPPRIVVYGAPKMGKTTFAASAESPIFLCTEDGLGMLQVPHWTINSWEEAIKALEVLEKEKHDFKTVVIDTLDKLECLLHFHIAKEGNKKTIDDFGFQRGYKVAAEAFIFLTEKLDLLQAKGMVVLLLCHQSVHHITPPDENDGWDEITLDLHKKATPVIQDWSDAILYVKEKVFTKKIGEGLRERHKAVSTGERVLLTERRPSHLAGNRYGLPYEIPLVSPGGWKLLAQEIKSKK